MLQNLAFSKQWGGGRRTRLVILPHTKRSLSLGRFQAFKILSPTIEIFVDNFHGKIFTVYLWASDRLVDLKAKIQAETRVSGSDQSIFYGEKRMRMNWRLSAYGLRDGCTIKFYIKSTIQGTAGYGSLFVDLENKNALQRIPIKFGSGRQSTEVSTGLNIEGTCTSMPCVAFGRKVISPIHFHPFDIVTDKARCPMCSCTMEATTCGFVDCQWMFTGRRKGSEADIMSEWDLAGHEYVRFREAGNLVDWEVLIISAIHYQSGQECDMCLSVMRFSDEKERLACGCQFHSNCVAQWNEHETGCPNCSREESTSHGPMEVMESKPKTCPVEVFGSKSKTRSFWRLCQG